MIIMFFSPGAFRVHRAAACPRPDRNRDGARAVDALRDELLVLPQRKGVRPGSRGRLPRHRARASSEEAGDDTNECVTMTLWCLSLSLSLSLSPLALFTTLVESNYVLSLTKILPYTTSTPDGMIKSKASFQIPVKFE